MAEYIPNTAKWVRDQVELYESSNGTEGITIGEPEWPVIIVTHLGRKTGAIHKIPLIRVVDGDNYVMVASLGGAPKNPVWYYNLKANPNVEIRDKTEVWPMTVQEVVDPG
jgi:deazaflavin-dependent oxidoreductase (nitroreductase family)